MPSPNDTQVIATNECVAKCPKGDGSPAATETYRVCQDACIAQHFYSTSVGTPNPTGGSGSGSGSGNGGGSGSGTGAGGASATGSGATPSSTGTSGAQAVKVGSAASFLGLIAAIMAV